MKRVVAILFVATILAATIWKTSRNNGHPEQSRASSTEAAAGPATTQDGGRQLGPFRVAANQYRVVLQERPRAPGSTQETGNTVVKMEIQDATGRVEYQRTFPDQTEFEGFSDAWFVIPTVFAGRGGTGLMINYELDSEPSAPTPENDSWWQLFGVVDGRLKPFSGPISVQGDLLPNDSLSDTLQFKVWAHHYRLIFPVTVNWSEGRLAPAMQCGSCEYRVLPEDLSGRDDLTFVRICPAIETQCANPVRILVKKDSAIGLVAGNAAVRWSEGSASASSGDPRNPMADEGAISVPEEVWIRVRIDGKEGWLHEDEDFTALNLPFEQ